MATLSKLFFADYYKTLEPGIYIPRGFPDIPEEYHGIGIRIEDDVALSSFGTQILSAGCPKEIEDIESLMENARAV